MTLFLNWQCSLSQIAVVVFPRPEEMKARVDKRFRETGKVLTDEAVNEMLGRYRQVTLFV